MDDQAVIARQPSAAPYQIGPAPQRQGVTLAEMSPEQRATAADQIDRVAATAWWTAQQLGADGHPGPATDQLSWSEQLRTQADAIRAMPAQLRTRPGVIKASR